MLSGCFCISVNKNSTLKEHNKSHLHVWMSHNHSHHHCFLSWSKTTMQLRSLLLMDHWKNWLRFQLQQVQSSSCHCFISFLALMFTDLPNEIQFNNGLKQKLPPCQFPLVSSALLGAAWINVNILFVLFRDESNLNRRQNWKEGRNDVGGEK